MKFIASKKLSDNTLLRSIILWMLVAFMFAAGLSATAKVIEYGMTPAQWINTVFGNAEEFTDPLSMNDLLLSVHTDLFGLMLMFILVASVYARTSRRMGVKMAFFTLSLVSLLFYPAALLSSFLIGATAVSVAFGSFFLFHLLIVVSSIDLILLLIRRKF